MLRVIRRTLATLCVLFVALLFSVLTTTPAHAQYLPSDSSMPEVSSDSSGGQQLSSGFWQSGSGGIPNTNNLQSGQIVPGSQVIYAGGSGGGYYHYPAGQPSLTQPGTSPSQPIQQLLGGLQLGESSGFTQTPSGTFRGGLVGGSRPRVLPDDSRRQQLAMHLLLLGGKISQIVALHKPPTPIFFLKPQSLLMLCQAGNTASCQELLDLQNPGSHLKYHKPGSQLIQG